MESSMLTQYMSLKGFTLDDLFNFNCIVVDKNNYLSNKDCVWLNSLVEYAVPDQPNVVCSVKDIIKKKMYRYNNEGCDSAIFVPLFRLSGEFTGFSIRRMDPVNKHDSWFIPGTRKLDMLFNLTKAFDFAAKKNSIIITEGVYDTMALVKHGFNNAVALLGTSMSPIQFFQLSSIVDNIALCLDNDNAGIKAMSKIVSSFKDFNINFYKVNIDKDPDEFLTEHGASEFKRRIQKWT